MESMEPKFEKKSSVERIVGYNEEEKEEIKDILEERFKKQDIKEIEETEEFEGLEEKEIKKTPEQIKIIKLVDEETNKLLAKYDLPEFKIPPKNVHFLSKDDYTASRGTKGTDRAYFSPYSQSVFAEEPASKTSFAHSMFHELLHFKSYQAFQKKIGKEEPPDIYRLGLMVFSRDGKREYFRNLTDAVTEELSKRFYFETIRNSPLFKEEIKTVEKIREGLLRMSKTEKQKNNAMEIFQMRPAEEKGILQSLPFPYKKERNMLNGLLEKLYQRNQDKFKDKEEVFDIFAKSMLNGNLLPVGKLVDRTLGKGSFRKIGELDNDIDKQSEFVGKL